MAFVKVANVDELPMRGLVGVEVEGRKIALVATGNGAYYALEDKCSHENYPLSDGEIIDGDRVECIYHGAKFDPASGRAVALPAIRPVKTYDVKVEDGAVLIDVG